MMVRQQRTVGGGVLLGLLVLSTMNQTDEAKAVKVVKKQGGEVTVDTKRPGKPVVGVALMGTAVTDAGLKALKELKSLKTLNLDFTKVTDAGLKNLKELKSLQTLYLGGTAVTDAGLKNLKELKSLQTLDLGGTKITDTGMKELKDLKS